ncbi:MAG: DUF2974 domain-containing protein [Eubacteriales bacterium]|nr:DUF2974 domain-containing protein [Eubacteriales bacterium]
MFDYLDWRGDLSFDQSPLCSIDMLIFAVLSYCPMEALGHERGDENLAALENAVYPGTPSQENELAQLRRKLWHICAKSRRFADVTLARFVSHFDPSAEKQFAAALFELADHTAIIAFRGTDATVVGWKEDFNLAFETPIPAQEDAVRFLNEAVPAYEKIYVCGHSKGGNLSLYAAAHSDSEVRNHLVEIYSFDGPGLDDVTYSSTSYLEIESRIRSFVPESSIVGMLMDYHSEYTIIDSDGVSIWQHNPFLWHIKGPAFVTKPKLTRSGKFTDRTLHDFLASCTPDDRRVLVNTIFEIVNATGAHKLRDIPGGVARNWLQVYTALKKVPPEKQKLMEKMLKSLAEAGGSNLDALLGR